MPEDASTVLLVEDDPTTLAFLTENLTVDGWSVATARGAHDGVEILAERFPDVVVVDLQLPDGSGLDVLRAIRDAGETGTRVDPATPVLILSGRGAEVDRLRGFERGCDDYLVKPFSYPELRARLTALVRRVQTPTVRGRLAYGPLRLDPLSRVVLLHGTRIELAAKEFALLRMLLGEPLRVFTKDELMRGVWGYRTTSTRTLDSHACRLRRRLAAQGDRFVVNVWGVGYRLADGAPA